MLMVAFFTVELEGFPSFFQEIRGAFPISLIDSSFCVIDRIQ